MLKKICLLLAVVCTLHTAARAGDLREPRLTPPTADMKRWRLDLNGKWLFHPAPPASFWTQSDKKDWKSINVPAEWVMEGFEVEKDKAAGYSRTFRVPSAWRDMRVRLRCNAVYSDSRVYINGRMAGKHLGGMTAFELDVTDLVRPGEENRIDLAVISEGPANATSSAAQYAVHPLGGITRDIYLTALPETHFSLFHVSTTFDKDYTDAVLKAEVAITNESKAALNGAQLVFELKDAEGQTVLAPVTRPTGRIASGADGLSVQTFDIKNPRKWDSEHPYLYTLSCKLVAGGKTVTETVRRVGFRQIEVRGNQVFVNNMPIKLRGACHHEVMPRRGRSMNDDQWRKDVEIFRRGNVNYLRTSHYPPDERLLEAADELGMFVEVEAPFCWAHNAPAVPDSLWNDIFVNQHLEMVSLNRSHPSVLIWSMGNESLKWKELFTRAADTVKVVDPTRPRIFSQWSPDADEGALEITNHHYPGPSGPDTYRNSKRPVTFDEFCHLNAYNRLELAADPGVRNLWGDLLDAMWTRMYYSQGVLGGAIWAGIDDTFFLPPDMRAVGYGTWGPIDGWRREKPEYWGMKKAFSPVKIKLKGNAAADGTLRFDVENRHNFTDLSECSLAWRAGRAQGKVEITLAPRKNGSFTIELPEEARREQTVELHVTGGRGFEIDVYRFQILPLAKKDEPAGRKVEQTIRETAEAIEITAGDRRFSISKRNGLLSTERKGKSELKDVPSLMVIPLNGYGEGIQMVGRDQNFTPFNPVCEDWLASSVSYSTGTEGTDITVKGAYKEAEGQFVYHIDATGGLTVDYDFRMKQDISPRQFGLRFTLPASYTHLAWKRRGYWNVYPEEHIGALEGKAEAFDRSLPVSGIAGPHDKPSKSWIYDQTAAGSNNFRSTKTGIEWAELSGKGDEMLRVNSDGTQHTRTWIDGECIRLLVADYNNAGSEGYLQPHAAVDQKPLKRGDTIKGRIRLTF